MKLISSPSDTIPVGSTLKLSCTVSNQNFPVMWRKDGRDVGENCKRYNDMGFTCETERDVGTSKYELKISAARVTDAGKWSCTHGPVSNASVNVHVIFPSKVYPLEVYSTSRVSGGNRSPVKSASYGSNRITHLLGPGTLRQPIDLAKGRSRGDTQDVIIECRSNCASSAHELRWELLNNTRLELMHPPESSIHQEGCPTGQHRLVQSLVFGCLHGSTNSFVRKAERNALVGLNRLICAPDHGKLTELIESPHDDHFQWRRLYTSSLWPPSHWFSVTEGNSAGQQQQFECATRTGELPFACVHILCPGNPTEWFTWGERVALTVSSVIFLMICLFLCYLTRHRRRAKQRTSLAPGQQHEVELML